MKPTDIQDYCLHSELQGTKIQHRGRGKYLEHKRIKCWGSSGCGYQDKYQNMVTTSSFSGFVTTAKEGKYLPSTPQGYQWEWNREYQWNVTLPLYPLHCV